MALTAELCADLLLAVQLDPCLVHLDGYLHDRAGKAALVKKLYHVDEVKTARSFDTEFATHSATMFQGISVLPADCSEGHNQTCTVNQRFHTTDEGLPNEMRFVLRHVEHDVGVKYNSYGVRSLTQSLRNLITTWVKSAKQDLQDDEMFNVTDFKIRGKELHRALNTSFMGRMNLLARRRKLRNSLETLDMVISPRGAITGNHTDVMHSLNHGLCGKKLWLWWGFAEGAAAGLLTDACHGHEAFDFRTFMSLPRYTLY
jgi:hypothetical protein